SNRKDMILCRLSDRTISAQFAHASILEVMACAICEIRRPKRYCPGVRGEICSLCCGNEREVSVHCPFECEFLQDARKHDKLPPVNPDEFPNQDIKVTDDFLHENEELLVFLGRGIMGSAMEADAVDNDVREALDALI